MMCFDFCLRIQGLQVSQLVAQGVHLGWSEVSFKLTLSVDSTYKADAYGL